MPNLNLVEQAQVFVTEALTAGAIAVDATVGNGFDTVFLARQVGPQGQVFGFDLQARALQVCREKLQAAGCLETVQLFQLGHENMGRCLPETVQGRVRAVMFNLGYLPGGDKAFITRPQTTLAAIEAALTLLAAGGRMSIIAYTGHSGGQGETERVMQWLESRLAEASFQRASLVPEHTHRSPPRLIMIEKRAQVLGLEAEVPAATIR